MNMFYLKDFFHFDPLSHIMITLILFVGVNVAAFSSRFLKGDAYYGRFFGFLALQILSICITVSADHLGLLLAGWGLSNFCLLKLMIHKEKWEAAKCSGVVAAKNFLLGVSLIALAFLLLYLATGQSSIKLLVKNEMHSSIGNFALFLIILGAMTQSAIWPFNTWLLSSLNSPTPVSALMHAGLVNGGGFLLARFAPLFLQSPVVLNFLFVVGIVSALMGTLWKLMQHDVKRMLACSTMGQMGFMFAQCGLGLFPAAVAHLCWHGLFKSYLFFNSPSSVTEKRVQFNSPQSLWHFLIAILCGWGTVFTFNYIHGYTVFKMDTTLIPQTVAFVAGTQLALSFVSIGISFWRVTLAFFFACLTGGYYGFTIKLIESYLTPGYFIPQPLNMFHFIGLSLLILAWLGVLFGKRLNISKSPPAWIQRLYVRALNLCQPDPNTITANRNSYNYL